MARHKLLMPELTTEDIDDFFSGKAPESSTHRYLPSGVYQGRCFEPKPVPSDDCFVKTTLRETYDLLEDYEEEEPYVPEDPFGSMISGDMQNLEIESIAPSLMNDLDALSVLETKPCVYDNYNFDHNYDRTLPIFQFREEILRTVATNIVTIIQGSTGSGKTTQVPQYILDEYARTNKHCNIVVTQPRKLAATSIAHRVCQERKWNIGHVVGYQVGLDKKTSQDTRITYVTTGVLLRHLIQAKSMNEYTHVILDEVHERDQDTDFAMLLVRKLLWLNSKKVKVILMSATIDTTVFAEYFGTPVCGMLQGAPTIEVGGRMFAVEENYIEKIDGLGERPDFDICRPEISEQAYAIAARLIIHFDNMEMEELSNGSPSSTSSTPVEQFRGSVLVFLPGIFEIREMEEILKYEKVNKKLQIIPLHSSITLEEQGMVFSKPKPGHRKVILSTNIAESSITVPDIKYVVDFCLTKAMVCDLDTNYQSLRLQWTSQASSKQRSGRAGRVSSGKAYRLVTKSFWMNELDSYATPEIQRCSLESAILKVKLLDLGDPRSILSLALSPPDLHNIERTILLLKEIGALKISNKQRRLDGDLTFVGRVLAALPIDMRLGKLVMLGFVFGCFTNCLIIAAALSKPSFFASPYNKGLESYAKKLSWADGTFSDPIAMLNAYKAWFKCQETNKFRRKSDEKDWGKKNLIQIRRIHEVKFQIDELRHRLRHFNIRSDDADHWSMDDAKQNEMILKVTMAGAFYPNYFEQTTLDEAGSVKQMSLLDPTKTVMFTSLPSGKGPLFRDALVMSTRPCGQAKSVYYDGSKAFVEFEDKSDLKTGKVLPAVYLACKMRKINRRVELNQSFAEKECDPHKVFRPPPFLYDPISENKCKGELPKPGGKMWFPMKITWVSSTTHLWGTKLLPENIGYLRRLTFAFQNELSIKIPEENLEVGMLVMAPFDDGETVSYYRAVINQLHPTITVWFVDYGNRLCNLFPKDLRQVPASIKDIPFQAILLRLRGIQRVESRSFKDGEHYLNMLLQASQFHVKVKVFSVVSDVVCVDLFTRDNNLVNEALVGQNFCEPMEESKISQLSHVSWETAEKEGITNELVFARWHSEQWTKVDDSMRGQAISMSQSRCVSVFGPQTTFEANFRSVINIGQMRNVNVDQGSINSVCINQNITDPDRSIMMVASEVGINQNGSTMLARNTTLMPNIRGLHPLLCVLFAPVVEFRVDATQKKYTGAICGLGSLVSKNGTCFSVLPDHDIEVSFDTEFDVDDIIEVNGLRMTINVSVGNGEEIASWSQAVVHKFQKNARQKLLSLLEKHRAGVDALPSQRPFRWRLITDSDLMSSNINDELANSRDLYRLHQGVVLRVGDGKWQ